MKLFSTLSGAIDKLPNGISSKVGRVGLKASKHSPVVLFGAGVVGVVATVVLASRATLKLETVLDDAKKKIEQAELALETAPDKYTEQDHKRDLVIVRGTVAMDVIKLYGPAVIIGVASVAALTGSHVILSKRNVALTAAYAALEKGFADYRRRVTDAVGEDKERELRHGYVEKDVVDETEDGTVVTTVKRVDPNTRSPYAKFFDEMNPNFNRQGDYNLLFLRAQQNYANDKLRARGHLFLNEVYESLGMDHTKAGAVVGWVVSKDGDNFVDFGIFDGDNPRARDFVNGLEKAIILDFNVDGIIYDKID